MLEKKEFSSLLITLMSLKLLFNFPLNLIKNSANAAWIQVIFLTLVALLLFYITTRVYEKRINLIELAKIHTNKPIKIIVGLLIFAVMLMNMMSMMRVFPESVKIILLKNTDTGVITGVYAITIFIGALLGIKAVAKVNYIFLSICGILLLGFILLLIPYYKIENIFPILGNGAKCLFLGGIKHISLFSDIIVLNILIAYSKNLGDAKKSGYKAIIISGIVGVIITLLYGMVYPYPQSERFILPMYQLTRMIHLGNFFNRFEALFQFIWSILAFLYGAVYLYMLCFVWQITFGLKYLKPLILPMIILVSGLALLPESIMDIMQISEIFEYISYPIAFFLPIIIGGIDKRRKLNENS